jgi:Zn-finger domain-containing protein
MDKIEINGEKAREMHSRLERAVAAHKLALAHLTVAITETEASRTALHDAGLQCWIDRLDSENEH